MVGRPTYETEEDLRKEQVVADICLHHYKMDLKKTAKYYPVDFIGHSSHYSRWMMVEVRCRDHVWGEYPTVYVSQSKIAEIVPHLHSGLGFVFVVATHDKLGFFTMLHASKVASYETSFMISDRRNDPADCELVKEIPIGAFNLLELSENERRKLWNTQC